MQKIRLVISILGGVVLLVALFYFVIGSIRPKFAGIYIDTLPASTVFLNGERIGRTPYRNIVAPGDTVVRLEPDNLGVTLITYETKINLIAGVETVVRHSFGTTGENASGDIISFEKNTRGETSLIAISTPDSAELVIDGREKVFTPYKTSNVSSGHHILKFSLPGYAERAVQVKIVEGYKLTAIVNLAKEPDIPKDEPDMPTPSPTETGQVEILATEVGYLRVRSEPSSVANEIGRVVPGKRYNLLETDAKTGWYKIEFEQGTGWVSSQFARKLGTTDNEDSASPSAVTTTPTITP